MTGGVKIVQGTGATYGAWLEGYNVQSAGIIMNNLTASVGRKYSIYSNNQGILVIGDETAGQGRISIDSVGKIVIGGYLSVSSTTTSTFAGDISATGRTISAATVNATTALQVNGVDISTIYVPQTRSVIAGNGLTGGGTMAADRTLAVNYGGDGAALTVSRSDHSHSNYAKGVSANYGLITGDDGTDAWVTLFRAGDSTNTPIICNVRAYAHTSVSFVVSSGYNGSQPVISVLNVQRNSINNSYKYVKAIRILSNQDVQIKLNGGGAVGSVILNVQAIGSGVNNPVLSATLTKDTVDHSTDTVTVTASIDPLIHNTIHLNDGGEFYTGTYKVWHAGSFNPALKVDTTRTISAGTGLTGGGDLSANRSLAVSFGTSAGTVAEGNHTHAGYLSTGSNQTAGSGFTASNTLFVGAGTTYNSGDLYVRNESGVSTIQLDGKGDAVTDSVNTKVYISGLGSAFFKGTVSVDTLQVNNAARVPNLNASLLNDIAEPSLAKNESLRDATGFGIVYGLKLTQNTPTPDNQAIVEPGTVFTASGRRITFPINTRVSFGSRYGTYDRYDVVYIMGPSAGNNEGTIAVVSGANNAGLVVPEIPADAVKVAQVLISAGTGQPTITDGRESTPNLITDVRKMRPINFLHDNGVESGLAVVQQSTPNMTVQVGTGYAYTLSGKRYAYPSVTNLTVQAASPSLNRIDVVFIKGESYLGEEGTIAILAGEAKTTPYEPVIPVDCIKLATISVTAAMSSVTTAKVTDARKMKTTNTFNVLDNVVVGGTIKEGTDLLSVKYANLGKAGIVYHNNYYGRQMIHWDGQMGSDFTKSAICIIDDAAGLSLGLSRDEIYTNSTLKIKGVLGLTFNDSVNIGGNGTLRASKNATTLNWSGTAWTSTNANFTLAGTTADSVVVTHAFGNANYSVALTANIVDRHIGWSTKTGNAITVIVDDGASVTGAFSIDLILIGQ
jgi:hypothetical protein